MFASRRGFIQTIGLAGAALYGSSPLEANPLNRPIGLQLYTVGSELGADYNGTIKKIAAIGYREVELAQTFNKSATELRASFTDNGLTCRSVHMFDMSKTPEQFMDFAKEIGATYVVTSFNPPANVRAAISSDKPDINAFLKGLESMTVDDYKRSADIANHLGDLAHKNGLTYAYHNHNLEFKKYDGKTLFDILLANTNPETVKLELDCGWVAAAGYNPAQLIEQHQDRVRLLHIKAFKPGPPSTSLSGPDKPVPTELGRGIPDYKEVFAAAAKGQIAQYYVEQEPPFKDMTALEAVRIDYQYLHDLS